MKIEQVKSADGTTIAFETTGAGAPLILVGGAFCDRTARSSGTPLAALLADRFSVFSYDRRGRGDSGNAPRYALERELEDLGALISVAGGSAFVFGMSSGALLALDAAVQGLSIPKLAVYEPPVVLDENRVRSLEGLAQELADATTEGRRADAAEMFLIRGVQMPAPVVAQMRQSPIWPGLERLAHTLSYDVVISARGPARLAEVPAIRASTLVMAGGASPAWMREANRTLASVIPNASLRTLEGQTHDVDVATLAGALREFFA